MVNSLKIAKARNKVPYAPHLESEIVIVEHYSSN